MDVNLNAVTVENDEAAQQYEARVNGQMAIIQYRRGEGKITFTHTEVPEALEGHGIAAKMARVALEDARARRLAVIPLCPYVASYIHRHQEYLDLVPHEYHKYVLEA
jgi:predicted GNAT family acetyltransferase